MRGQRLLCGFLVLAFAVSARAQTQQTWAYDHVHLAAPDPEKTREWYIRHMGGKPSDDDGNVVPIDKAGRVAFDRITFIVQKAPTAQPSSGSVIDNIGFSFADLDAKMKELETAGIKVDAPVREMPGLWKHAVIEDPYRSSRLPADKS
jgi:catechol 2,3-dioxygenase-like lactoylglutathione lyase family enzyme